MFTRVGVLLFLVFVHVTYVSQTPATRTNSNRGEPVNSDSVARLGLLRGNGPATGQGEPLKRSISTGETQNVQIDLVSGQYAEIVFEWQGIDLGVALFDSTGARLLPSDVLVSSPGPVAVSILADKTGTYKLKISPQVKQKISGEFEIKLGEPRLPTTADNNRLLAQISIAQGQQASITSAKVDNYKQALILLQAAGDVNGAARTLLLLGDTYKANREVANAKTSYEQAVELWKTSHYGRGEAYAKVSLAQLNRSFVSPKDSLVPYEEAELQFAQIGDVRGQADASYGHAFALMLLGQTPQTISILERTLLDRRAIGDRAGEASALNLMADCYRLFGDFDKSLDLYEKARLLLRDLENRFLEAVVSNNEALIYDDQGYWQRAKDAYIRSLGVCESLLGRAPLTACSSNIDLQHIPVCRLAAAVLINLGETYNSVGDPESAKEKFSNALIIEDSLREPKGQGLARFHLGYAHFLLGEPAKAIELYQEALTYQKLDKEGAAQTYTYMGMARIARNESKIALDLFLDARRIQEASGDKRALAITLDKLATAYSLEGNYREAANTYANALKLWREIKDPDGEALTLYNMASVERRTDQLNAANEHAEASLKLVEALRTRLTSQKLRLSYLANKQDYYQLDVDVKMALANSLQDKAYIVAALEANEKDRARSLLDALSEANVGRSIQSGDPDLRKLLDQQLGLLQRLASKTQARTRFLSGPHTPEQISVVDNEITAITEQLDELETQVRKKSPRFANLTTPQPATAIEIQQQLDKQTLLLEYALGEKRSYVWVVSSDLVKGFELADRRKIETAAGAVTKAITARNVQVKNESWPERQQRVIKAETDYSEAADVLSKMILEPIASLLNNKRLVVVADGALQFVPFSALPAPANSSGERPSPQENSASVVATNREPLIKEHEIISLPSTSVLALQRRELASRKPAPLAVAVIADPVFDSQDDRVAQARFNVNQHRKDMAAARPEDAMQSKAVAAKVPQANSTPTNKPALLASALRDVGVDSEGSLPRLSLSRAEARGIAKAAPPKQSFTALDFKASRETATSPELSKYRVIHFATHGLLDLEHPELSGIVLSMVDEKGEPQDGYLRLHEIYNLNLPAELVVLSACQTGIGKQIRGEGLIALTRGFMYAGAARVVASLWKVDDSATAELMTEFYKQMFTNKLKPAAALREAQLKLAQQKRWQSPYYWAGFFLQGEWN